MRRLPNKRHECAPCWHKNEILQVLHREKKPVHFYKTKTIQQNRIILVHMKSLNTEHRRFVYTLQFLSVQSNKGGECYGVRRPMQILNYANSDANAPNTDTPTSDSFERNKRVKKKTIPKMRTKQLSWKATNICVTYIRVFPTFSFDKKKVFPSKSVWVSTTFAFALIFKFINYIPLIA